MENPKNRPTPMDTLATSQNNSGSMVKPTIADVLATTPTKSGNTDGVPKTRKPYKKRESQEPIPEVLLWTDRKVAVFADAPFNIGYWVYGKTHEHWLDSKATAQAVYPNIADIFNELGLTHPKYLALAAVLSEYLTIVGKAYAKSYSLKKAEKKS